MEKLRGQLADCTASSGWRQIAFGDEQMGTARYLVGGTELLVYYGMPAPYLLQQEIFIELIPNGSNVFCR